MITELKVGSRYLKVHEVPEGSLQERERLFTGVCSERIRRMASTSDSFRH